MGQRWSGTQRLSAVDEVSFYLLHYSVLHGIGEKMSFRGRCTDSDVVGLCP